MIRLNALDCKLKNTILSVRDLFRQSLEQSPLFLLVCPYCGAKGTCNKRGSYERSLVTFHSLHEFEALLMDYVRSYNTAYHSGIGCTPFERYRSAKEHVRLPRSREWLEESFLNRVTRKVRKDAAVPIDRVSYDVPMQFISRKVEIRYLSEDMDSAFIFYEGEHFPIRATDKNENCRTKRKNNPPVDYTKIGGGN